MVQILASFIIVIIIMMASSSSSSLLGRRLIRNTLLVASKTDPAGVNLFTSLLDAGRANNLWREVEAGVPLLVANKKNGRGKCVLWLHEEPLLGLNYVNVVAQERCKMEAGFDDMIFLSKHKAASGTASLTVHPIGIPSQSLKENADYGSGGVAGMCSPPSRRIASLYRAINALVKAKGMDSTFQTTLEATHHGPQVDIPVCFVEIGSNECDWSIPEAGAAWSQVLLHNLSLEESSPLAEEKKVEEEEEEGKEDEEEKEAAAEASGLVVVGIGGGHYCPKLNDCSRLGPNIYSAHCLATYTLESHLEGRAEALPFGCPEDTKAFEYVIDRVISSTRISYPSSRLICIVDKKSFKAEHRTLITTHLQKTGVEWTYSVSDIKSIYSATYA